MTAATLEPTDGGPEDEESERDSLLGTKLAGKYELIDVLGEGAMGRIYRAKQEGLDRQIAIKVLHRHLGGEDRVARRFHREARAASRLSHPNSVQILDFGSENGILYIAMELLEGEDLQTILDHDGPLSPQRIAGVLVPVLRAVDEAHRAGIVHRDLKPENVIVWSDRSGREHVKVCDFGIAKILDGEGNSITVDGFVCGTPQYMAPEQARGDVIDHRVDVYAAGVVLYQMLAGKVPFTGETALGIITRHLTDDPVPPSQRDPKRHVPASLERVALKAMEKSPTDRFQSAGDMADALGRAVAELGDDAGLSLGNEALAKYAASHPPRRDPTGPRTTDRREASGVSTAVDAEAATTELARSLPPRAVRGSNVVLGSIALAAIAVAVYLALRPAPPAPSPPAIPAATHPPEPAPPEPEEALAPPELAEVVAPESTAAAVPEPSASGRPHPRTTPAPEPRVEPSEATTPRSEVVPPTPPTPALSPGAAAFAEGRRLFLANDVEGAIARFEEAARLMPRDAEVQRQLGRAHMRAGSVSSSVAAYRRYLELSPDAPDRTVVESIIARNGG